VFKSVKIPIFWYFSVSIFNSSPDSALFSSGSGSSNERFIELVDNALFQTFLILFNNYKIFNYQL